MNQVPSSVWVWICKVHGVTLTACCSRCVTVRYVLPKEHSKRYQAEHRKQGLCICCPRKATRGLRCTRCANKHAAQERSRRSKS